MDVPAVVVCRKCGQVEDPAAAVSLGWLVIEHPAGSGRWVMACPIHITSYVRRMVGLPERLSTKLVDRLADGGLEFERDGTRYFAARGMSGTGYLLQSKAPGGPVIGGWEDQWFDSLDGLVLAMQRVGSLRRWHAAG